VSCLGGFGGGGLGGVGGGVWSIQKENVSRKNARNSVIFHQNGCLRDVVSQSEGVLTVQGTLLPMGEVVTRSFRTPTLSRQTCEEKRKKDKKLLKESRVSVVTHRRGRAVEVKDRGHGKYHWGR